MKNKLRLLRLGYIIPLILLSIYCVICTIVIISQKSNDIVSTLIDTYAVFSVFLFSALTELWWFWSILLIYMIVAETLIKYKEKDYVEPYSIELETKLKRQLVIWRILLVIQILIHVSLVISSIPMSRYMENGIGYYYTEPGLKYDIYNWLMALLATYLISALIAIIATILLIVAIIKIKGLKHKIIWAWRNRDLQEENQE